jgi:hypothetical protein
MANDLVPFNNQQNPPAQREQSIAQSGGDSATEPWFSFDDVEDAEFTPADSGWGKSLGGAEPFIQESGEMAAGEIAGGAAAGGPLGLAAGAAFAAAQEAMSGLESLAQSAGTTGSIHEYQIGGSSPGGGNASGAAVLAALNKLAGTRSRM